MRCYKLGTQKGYSALGNSILEYSKEKEEYLLNNKWEYSSLFRQYRKRIIPFLDIVLDLNRNALFFYSSRYFPPNELDYYLNGNKENRDTIYKLVRELKKEGILK